MYLYLPRKQNDFAEFFSVTILKKGRTVFFFIILFLTNKYVNTHSTRRLYHTDLVFLVSAEATAAFDAWAWKTFQI